jgi:hypothetical protein
MAIMQSDWALGQKAVPLCGAAGVVHTERFRFVVSSNVTTNDIIELGVLPAGAIITDAVLNADELGAVTLTAGLMTGTVGDTDGGRTCGAELFSGAADASVVRASIAAGLRLTATDADRSIGVKVSGTVTASDQVIDLLVSYRQ